MKREIKFRGKRLDNGKWLVGDLIENQGRFFIYHATSETTIEDDYGRISILAVEVDPSTVGQYTGMKDKNGREIYEDDIVRCNEYIGKVIFESGMFARKVKNVSAPLSSLLLVTEVISNIHDNPQLLNQ